MRPGQVEPNEFETAILERISIEHPAIRSFLEKLHVLSRKFTGVGCFTEFLVDDATDDALASDLILNGLICMPNVPTGMGAVLFCKGGKPQCLETFTYGERWDGVYDGYSIESGGCK